MADHVPTPCPLCLGPLVSTGDFSVTCSDEGHGFGPVELTRAQQSHVVRALWGAVRALEDQAACAKWIAANDPQQAPHQVSQAKASMDDSNRIRELLDAVGPSSDT